MGEMPLPPRDPMWKTASAADVAQLSADVAAAAANLKAILARASAVQAGIEHQMGGDFTAMPRLLKLLRSLEESSEKVDEVSWGFADFAEKFRRWST